MSSCCTGNKKRPYDPSLDADLSLPLHQQVTVDPIKKNTLATFRESVSAAWHAPWRVIYNWNSVHYEDLLMEKGIEMATEVLQFALYSGFGNRVLGFWCALMILTWALCSLIYDILTLTLRHCFFDMIVLFMGVISMTLEFKVMLLPQKVMKVIEEDCRFMLKNYIRSVLYLFLGVYIMIQAFTSCRKEKDRETESWAPMTMIRIEGFETWICGFVIFLTSIFMLYRSFMTRTEMQKIIDEKLNMEQITEKFHNHQLCNGGTFQTSDFVEFLGSNNIDLPHDQLVSLMIEIDPNHTETISYYEFIAWYETFVTTAIYVNLLRVDVGLPLLYHVPGII